MRIEIGQIISQIISFLIMLWILRRYAWKPILRLMNERHHKIKSEFDAIEEKKKQLDELKRDYNEKLDQIDAQADFKIHEAVEKGRQIAQEIQEKARSQAKAIIQKAQEDSQYEVVKAKEQLKDEVVNMTLAATEKILQTHLDREKQKSLILDFIKQTEARS